MTEEMYERLHRMFEARMKYWREIGNFEASCSYESALAMLECAHDECDELLSAFDYYDYKFGLDKPKN